MTADDIIKVWDAVFANYCCGWLVLAFIVLVYFRPIHIVHGRSEE